MRATKMISNLKITILHFLYSVIAMEFQDDMFHRVFIPEDNFFAVMSFLNITSVIECGGMCLSNQMINFRSDIKQSVINYNTNDNTIKLK